MYFNSLTEIFQKKTDSSLLFAPVVGEMGPHIYHLNFALKRSVCMCCSISLAALVGALSTLFRVTFVPRFCLETEKLVFASILEGY